MIPDYQAIRADNEPRYGTEWGRIGPMLLANRYADRTHFIFELLQNAEDALARRAGWQGSRAVTFHLTESALRVSHFGHPFNDADVRGVCGIGESTKDDFTAIGRFGIGFKSVYACTDRPEVHSGTEDFAIENFVWPIAARPLDRDPNETLINIPLKASDDAIHDEIAAGLGRLGASALLFLRQIEEIRWTVDRARPRRRAGIAAYAYSQSGLRSVRAQRRRKPARWIEVKAMTRSWHSRPAGLSRTQFECAREHGDAYWFYVVEHAGTGTAHVVRIQYPFGKACTFTFDHGWLAVAEVDSERECQEADT